MEILKKFVYYTNFLEKCKNVEQLFNILTEEI